MEQHPLKIIARLHGDFPTKFGIPRQSGLVSSLQSTVVFEPEYRNPEAFRGLEGFSHIWLLWGFSALPATGWSPTVRPPRLGGNKRIGVFATRSPFRPNPIGLSCVQFSSMEHDPKLGVVLHVTGADLMDGSPVYDIKPYLPYADSHPEATGGFAETVMRSQLQVVIPPEWQTMIPDETREALIGVLAHDPRPSYQEDPNRRYGMEFAGLEVKFRVCEGVLTVCRVEHLS